MISIVGLPDFSPEIRKKSQTNSVMSSWKVRGSHWITANARAVHSMITADMSTRNRPPFLLRLPAHRSSPLCPTRHGRTWTGRWMEAEATTGAWGLAILRRSEASPRRPVSLRRPVSPGRPASPRRAGQLAARHPRRAKPPTPVLKNCLSMPFPISPFEIAGSVLN